ncbi:A-deaminase domain-containing protein [Fusarium sp. Ph1]|nr:A-deaminase domain-containing protein [Fusarium sp. Ph1]
MTQSTRQTAPPTWRHPPGALTGAEAINAQNHIAALDGEIASRRLIYKAEDAGTADSTTAESNPRTRDYFKLRQGIVTCEKTLHFDHMCWRGATPDERRADAIIQGLKRRDAVNVYEKAHSRTGYGGQLHLRFPGDHFLSNKSLVDQTDLFAVARRMPKGGHLHIHFNAGLAPHVLLNIAKDMDRMFITSDLPPRLRQRLLELRSLLDPVLPPEPPPGGGPLETCFDLVGEESKGRPIKDFIPELLKFQENCEASKVEIPFLFHCGETLDMGTNTDSNLIDALLLESKRIGYGFTLAKHPHLMQLMKERGVCLELCPVSNEILGLTPPLFRSSLSHDFYQVMIGKVGMGLFRWKQLMLWSLKHACLDQSEYARMYTHWETERKEFVKWVIQTYDEDTKAEDPTSSHHRDKW